VVKYTVYTAAASALLLSLLLVQFNNLLFRPFQAVPHALQATAGACLVSIGVFDSMHDAAT